MAHNKKVVDYLNKLEGFKTACKNAHFNSNGMSEHKLFDELSDFLHSGQDSFGEIEQGIHGKFGKNTIKGTEYKFTSPKKFIQDIILATKDFYKEIDGDDYIGMRSAVEDFMSNLDKQPYLLDLCLKEDFKRAYRMKINESIGQADSEELRDAVDALEMSDGQIDFYEWSAAYDGEDEEYLRLIWNTACEMTGNDCLTEGEVRQFTPYTPEERDRNFDELLHSTRSAEERNPAYARAKAEAEARRKAKMEEMTEEELRGVVAEAVQNVVGRMTIDESINRVIDNYINNL